MNPRTPDNPQSIRAGDTIWVAVACGGAVTIRGPGEETHIRAPQAAWMQIRYPPGADRRAHRAGTDPTASVELEQAVGGFYLASDDEDRKRAATTAATNSGQYRTPVGGGAVGPGKGPRRCQPVVQETVTHQRPRLTEWLTHELLKKRSNGRGNTGSDEEIAARAVLKDLSFVTCI